MRDDLAAGPADAHFQGYAGRMTAALQEMDWAPLERFAEDCLACWRDRKTLFLAGNGGSAGNANHIANDFMYPISKTLGVGMSTVSLTANPAVLTCLSNDEGYAEVFTHQLRAQAYPGDLLLVFSGSGNSENILRVLAAARELGVISHAVLGFDGGAAKQMADNAIHFAVHDMQVAEDLQTVACHMVVQWLYARREAFLTPQAPRGGRGKAP